MRRMTYVVCGIAAGLAALTACGTTATNGSGTTTAPAQQQVHTIADLAHVMSAKTATVHTAHMTFVAATPQGSVIGNGQIDIDGAASKVQMSMTIPSMGAMNVELLGSTMYLQLPQSLIKTSKPWVQINPNGTDPISKALSGVVSQEQQDTDPTKAISQLVGAGTITKVTPTTVDGQPATDYAITVDTQKLMNSSLVSPQLKQELTQMGVNLPKTLNYQMWLNSQNLPVKLIVQETVEGQQVDVTVTYTDWGAPITINPPPADQIGSLPGQ